QHVDLVGVEELARFDERRRWIVSSVLYDGLDGQATQLAVGLLEIEQEAVALRHAERAERTGEFGQHADLDRVLRLRARRRAKYRQPHADEQIQATHLSLLSWASRRSPACNTLQPARSLTMDSSATKRMAGASICTKFFSSSRIMAGIEDANIARMSSVDLKKSSTISSNGGFFSSGPSRPGEGGKKRAPPQRGVETASGPGRVAQP